MDLLILVAVNANNEGITSGVSFEVTGDGQALSVDLEGGVQLPAAPRPLRLKIKVRPPSQFFEVEGEFDYNGLGELAPVKDRVPSEFAPVRGVVDGLGNAVMSLLVFVSRVRDVSAKVLDLLQTLPDVRPEFTPVTDYALTPRTVSIVSPPPMIRAGNISFVPPTPGIPSIAPSTVVTVFEVKVEPAPKLIAVAWPDSVSRTEVSPPTPLLIYFHPNAGQNRATHYRGTYPFSYDYMFFGIIAYLRYARGLNGDPDPDPLQDIVGPKGLAYQMKASQKDMVLVLPVNRVGPELGVFMKAESMESILKELVAAMFRKNGVYRSAQLGRTALASFSAGNTLVTAFLSANKGNSFVQNNLMEVYNFDLPMGFSTGDVNMRAWAKAVSDWAATGNTADKRIRSYTQFNFASIYQQLLGVTPPTQTPYEVSDATGNRTAVVVPGDAWARISNQMPKPNGDFGLVHQIIPDTLLVDALRRSGF